MIRDGEMVCDQCGKTITHITSVPAEGYPKMHNLCSTCFDELRKQSISRA
jgi:hypothetical protein